MIDVLISPLFIGGSFWGLAFGALFFEARDRNVRRSVLRQLGGGLIGYSIGFGISLGAAWFWATVASFIWDSFGALLWSTFDTGLERGEFSLIFGAVYIAASPYLIGLALYGIWQGVTRIPSLARITATDILKLEERAADFWRVWGGPILRKTVISVVSSGIAFGIAALIGLKDGATISIVGITVMLTIAFT